jgi:nucleoside-diphosphate-sugar epimerase
MSESRQPRLFLVTGATGFIGSHVTTALINTFGSASVSAIVHPRLRTDESQTVAALRKHGATITECDLMDLPRAQPDLPSFDAVIHLAACAEPENARADFSVNDIGTRNLLEWLGLRLRGKRLVFASSLACVDRDRPSGPITEATPCTPRTPYGRTKLKAEEEVRQRRAEFGYDFTILRLCTIIGSGFRPTGMFGLCPSMLARNALATRFNWPGRASFLGMNDVVRLLLVAAAHSDAANQTFVVSNGEEPTFDEVLDMIAAVHGLPRHRIALPPWLWGILGTVAWRLARSPVTPFRLRIACWRAAHVIYDGICADASKLNVLFGSRYQSVRDALCEAYGK